MSSLTPAQRLGASPLQPEVALPAINVKLPSVSAIAHAIVSNLPTTCGLFRRYDTYITIDMVTDTMPDGSSFRKLQVREMTPTRLCSWLEQFMCFRNGSDDNAKATTLGKQTVEKIMASDIFHSAIKEVREIAKVRLPIWETAPDGTRHVVLAKPGYNPTMKLYVAPELDFSLDDAQRVTPAIAARVWSTLVKDYPFLAESPGEEKQTWPYMQETMEGPCPWTNRSACCAMAFMLGTFARYLYERAPIIIINGNQPGTGKSLLGQMCLSPVWGLASFTDKPRDDEEMTKVLNMVALEQKPYVFFDDVANVVSQSINEFATAAVRTGRVLGTAKSFEVPYRTQAIFTGNGLTTTPDIVRRSLIIDLWFDGDATKRKLSNPTEKTKFADLSWRANMLTLCWAMVRNWAEKGYPLTTPATAKPSFESFAQVVGSILHVNGFHSPFRARSADVAGGDLIGAAVLELIEHIAYMQRTNMQEQLHTYSIADIIQFSDALGLTVTITRDKKQHMAMGNQLRKWRGRTMHDRDGFPFEFGKGESAASSNYTFALKPKKDPQA